MQQQQPHRRALLAAPSGRPATGDSSSCLKERRHTPLAPAPPARRAGGRAGSSLARPLQRRRRRLPGQEGKAGAQVLPSLVELPPSESALLWPPPPEPGRGGAASLPSPAMAAAEAAAAAPLPVTVRPCRAEDCAEIARLIRELAEFEHLSEQVKISEQELCEDGFGPDPFYKCVVAEVPPECRSKGGHTIVGFGLYFFTYSTWKGRNIYMEDLYIMPEFRGTEFRWRREEGSFFQKRDREETDGQHCGDRLGAGLHPDEVRGAGLEPLGHRFLPQQRGRGPDSHRGLAHLPP
ncbi:uncharacterized protein LOC128331792 isoform X2 [Hemicordylus capensis]|uniref:uncharacterized protein LOC128331792 isoform X2 n=1 Tax=Hemicordylus capensis TaxID=884348 RepID=UPI0023047CA0|nr:uncharacterized protein LOC128331792 isoform X2 [Hemicordylus capensis]